MRLCSFAEQIALPRPPAEHPAKGRTTMILFVVRLCDLAEPTGPAQVFRR
jgi:hypothetical protein